MLNKKILEEKITGTFPDIYNSKFEINSEKNSSFTESILLPFMVYQNTVDKNHRLIGVYLSDSGNILNLIPFYILMGQLRKSLDVVMTAKGFQNESFKPSEVQVTLNANYCYVSYVDFINRIINLKFGTGGEKALPFSASYNLKKYNSNSERFLNKLFEFDTIDKADKSNLFTFPIAPKDLDYEGVIMFTNTSKFESLIKNIKVSDDDLRRYINIEKVIFPSNDGAPKFVRISLPPTANKPVSVLVARQDAFRAYTSILESGLGRLDHIRTIIIDDFDELVLKWEKADKLNDEVTCLKEELLRLLENKQLKDVYLICKNSSLNIHELLKKSGVDYKPWLVKPLETEYLDKDTISTPEVIITNVGNNRFEDLNERINSLLYSWKELGKNNFLNGEIITPISCLYELRLRLNSFFNPDRLKEFLKIFSNKLEELRNKWFGLGQDFGLILETVTFIEKCEEFENFKLKLLVDVLNTKKPRSNIKIVSDNNSEEDITWIKDFLHSSFPELTIFLMHKKKSITSIDNTCLNPEIIFYLTADKRILGNALGNILAKEQVFILKNESFAFASFYSNKYQQLQSEIGSTDRKLELLNINLPPNKQLEDSSGVLQVKLIKKDITDIDVYEEFQERESISELNDLVEEIITKSTSASSISCAKCILFFDEGSFEIFPETKKIYLYDDEMEQDDIDKSFKQVFQLRSGDQVVITKRDAPLKDILESSLKRDQHFAEAINMDSKWRMLIKNHIHRCKMDLNYFRRKLKDNGFTVESDQTVENWIDGYTRRPDKGFKKLLTSLSILGIINEAEIDLYDRHNSELKVMQMRFVRTAIGKLVGRLNGITNLNDKDFDDDLLNDFIDHIEIKRISTIHKI